MLAVILLLVLATVVVKWLRVRTRMKQVPGRPCMGQLLPAVVAEV